MPGHPSLTWNGTFFAIWSDDEEEAVNMGKVQDVVVVTDAITMHALRWLNGGSLRLSHGIASDGNADATLAGVLAATEHLEPKAP